MKKQIELDQVQDDYTGAWFMKENMDLSESMALDDKNKIELEAIRDEVNSLKLQLEGLEVLTDRYRRERNYYMAEYTDLKHRFVGLCVTQDMEKEVSG